jgi:hypothetical protein
MLNQANGGNPYRQYCLDCNRFDVAVSKSDWKNHLHPHVLPRDVDQDDSESIIPLEEWDESARFEKVVDRVARLQRDERPYRVIEGEEVNVFPCPNCNETLYGFPDECEACGAPFEWV